MNRRNFLRWALGAGAGMAFGGLGAFAGTTSESESKKRKLIVVLFGGGTRSSESIGDPEHRYIPHLWREMVPRGTLLTNMRVEHKVVHPNSAGSIVTGHWEWDDIDWSKPPVHPTIFEIYRKARNVPDTNTWAFVYASILAKAGESQDPRYGQQFAANVIEPPTIPRSTAEEMNRLREKAAATGSEEAESKAIAECARLARSTSRISTQGLRSDAARTFLEQEYAAWKLDSGSTSHDLFLTDRAINCMKNFAPDVIWVAYGEIDCAHYGSWSRYTEAIQQTDELTWRLWKAVNELPEYRDQTLLLILPDHGRELERPGGMGFIHHSDFYTNTGTDEGCRRVWMLALGPGIAAGKRMSKPIPITATAATGLNFLGLEASLGAASSVLPILSDKGDRHLSNSRSE